MHMRTHVLFSATCIALQQAAVTVSGFLLKNVSMKFSSRTCAYLMDLDGLGQCHQSQIIDDPVPLAVRLVNGVPSHLQPADTPKLKRDLVSA